MRSPEPRCRGLGRRHYRAFSLLELVIVVIIMAVFAQVGLSVIGQAAARAQLDGAVRRIVTDLGYARRLARNNSASQMVHFDLAQNQYTVPGATALSNSGQAYAVDLADEPYRAALVAVDFAGDADLIFDGYGRPDSGGTITVAVGDNQETILVDADTGRATVP